MKIDTIELLKNKLRKLRDPIIKKEYHQAFLQNRSIIRTYDFFDDVEGVFIGEFFDGLLNNLSNIVNNYEINNEMLNKINENLIELIGLFDENLPINDEKKKAIIYDSMAKTRMNVTQIQLECGKDEWPPKKRKDVLPASHLLQKLID